MIDLTLLSALPQEFREEAEVLRRWGLVEPAEVVENDSTVQVGFGVGIVDRECLIELFERAFWIPHHRQTKPRTIANVGEVWMVLEDHTKMLVRSLEVVLLPSGAAEGQRLPDRR